MNVSLKSLIMRDIFIYYQINLLFYIVEIVSFTFLYTIWPYDIFWLNALIRGFLSLFFSIIVRKTIFKDSKNFYVKFFFLVLLSPIASSTVLKILIGMFSHVEVWILKIIGDVVISIISFFILKNK
tara:strand:+ start:2414 stop:2791 length:378 start_codon:yes stop_codon:yes gene_type:complete